MKTIIYIFILLLIAPFGWGQSLKVVDSQLSISGKARRIYYAWGTGSIQDLQRTIDFKNKSEEYVAVHVNDLYEALKLGLIRFSEELENDPDRKVRVYKKAGKFFVHFSLEAMSDVLTVINDKGV